jgi:hypothetical protein
MISSQFPALSSFSEMLKSTTTSVLIYIAGSVSRFDGKPFETDKRTDGGYGDEY